MVAPEALLTDPAAQLVPEVAPGGHQRPGSQPIHVERFVAAAAALMVPAGQSVTLGAPCSQYPPGSHSSQAEALVAGW